MPPYIPSHVLPPPLLQASPLLLFSSSVPQNTALTPLESPLQATGGSSPSILLLSCSRWNEGLFLDRPPPFSQREGEGGKAGWFHSFLSLLLSPILPTPMNYGQGHQRGAYVAERGKKRERSRFLRRRRRYKRRREARDGWGGEKENCHDTKTATTYKGLAGWLEQQLSPFPTFFRWLLLRPRPGQSATQSAAARLGRAIGSKETFDRTRCNLWAPLPLFPSVCCCRAPSTSNSPFFLSCSSLQFSATAPPTSPSSPTCRPPARASPPRAARRSTATEGEAGTLTSRTAVAEAAGTTRRRTRTPSWCPPRRRSSHPPTHPPFPPPPPPGLQRMTR